MDPEKNGSKPDLLLYSQFLLPFFRREEKRGRNNQFTFNDPIDFYPFFHAVTFKTQKHKGHKSWQIKNQINHGVHGYKILSIVYIANSIRGFSTYIYFVKGIGIIISYSFIKLF